MFIVKWLLLQLAILKNKFCKEKDKFLFCACSRGAFLLLGFGLFYIFLIRMFEFTSRAQMQGFDFAAILLSFSLLVFLPLLSYNAIICALSFFFQRDEIGFFFSLPVSKSEIFCVKLWQVFSRSSWMACGAIFTFIMAIATYFHLPGLIYIGGLAATLAYLFIPVGLGVLITLILSRVVPFIRAKDILVVIGIFTAATLVFVLRMLQPERLISSEGKLRLLAFVQNIRSPWMTFLPSEWLTSVIVAYQQRDMSAVISNLSALVLLAAGVAGLIFFLAKAFYLGVWSDSLVAGDRGILEFHWQPLLRVFPEQLKALAHKDIISFYRNTVERGSLLVFIPMCALYLCSIYLLKRYIHNYGENIFSFLYQYLFNFFYAGLVISGLAGRWIFPAITAEGENFRLLRLGVLPLSEFLKAKFWLGFVPLFLLGEILALSSCFIIGVSFPLAAFAFFIILILTAGLTAIALILGIRMADFSVAEPMDFALSYRGFIFLTLALSFVSIVTLLSAIPVATFFKLGTGLLAYLVLGAFVLIAAVFFYFTLYAAYNNAAAYLNKRDLIS